MNYRMPAVAGSFYPDNAQDLAIMLEQVFARATENSCSAPAQKIEPQPKMLVVPHAGYVYSGAVAALAYEKIIPWADDISRVVLLGPSHRVAFRGMALVDVTEWQGFETPLGIVELDCKEIAKLALNPKLKIDNHPHYFEHSLEVQLPFLQKVLKHFTLLPIVVGQCEASDVAEVLQGFYQDKETLIIVSSDMSHFHDYASAKKIDADTNEKILHLEANVIGEQACGCYPLNGLLKLAKDNQLEIENLALFNSADNLLNANPAGIDKQRVVGYGAYVVH